MKKKYVILTTVVVLIFGIFGITYSIPKANALTMSYNDDVWSYLTVTGPDLTKPGNTESYTVTGALSVAFGAGTVVQIVFTVDTTSQLSKVLLQENLTLGEVFSPAGFSFSKIYQVFIPNDALNNKHVFAKLDTSTRHFSSFGVSLVQNPTYSDLQSQVVPLQSQVNSLNSTLNSLQSQVNSLQNNKSSLQSQITDLQNQKNSLQDNLNDTNRKLNTAYGAIVALIAIAIVTLAIAFRKSIGYSSAK